MSLPKLLLLGGNWCENIRESGYINKFYTALKSLENFDIKFQNGGTKEELHLYFQQLQEFSVVIWMANVPNTFDDKMVDKIKTQNQNIILVTSKNNLENKYHYMQLISRMLATKSNLELVFTKNTSGQIAGTVIDPLNNAFCLEETEISKVSSTLATRILQLLSYSRMGSRQIGEAKEIPNNEEFFNIAKHYAEIFHNIIHPENTSRFLGNLSFRCENGFPSFKQDNLIYVTRRNVDKRLIGKEGFVAIDANVTDCVCYYGEHKPSVDSPTLVQLYNYYVNVAYTIHSHVYIEGAPFTKHRIPCGALEEVDAVIEIISDKTTKNFAVNLLGRWKHSIRK
ncbi:class_II aldolase/adducin family protein [Hexamita inflata]|uniref:Class II aldolase/adducin family protein n=1 Tax=Hexamita inflata TaxID=28002 RepID=A0AA86PK77_9EUKA|nr:class II aldolase/adducin family protein [Hexamita inflata]